MTENGTGSNGSGSTDGPAGTPGPEGHRLLGLMDWYDTLPEKAQRVVANVILERGALISALTDQRRNLNQDCGYPEGYVQAQTYQELYDREPIPARVVEVVPLESWQVQPTVYEDEDPGTETEFEKTWDALGKSLSAATGYYRAEMGSVVWEYLCRADVLSGIGQYGVVLLGLDDGKDLSEPAEFVGPPPPWMQDSAPDATPERDRPGGPGPTGGPDVPPPGVLPAGTADIGTGMGRPSGGQPLGYPVRNVLGEGYAQALSILERGFQTNRGAVTGDGSGNRVVATTDQGLALNGWVTLESGQRVYIGDGGKVMPSGPGGGAGGRERAASSQSKVSTDKGNAEPKLPAVGETVKVGGTKYVTEPFDGDDTFPPAIAAYELKEGYLLYTGRNGSEGVVTGTKAEAEKWMADVRKEVQHNPPADAISRLWQPSDGGAANVERAKRMVEHTAATFGIPAPDIRVGVAERPMEGGEHSASVVDLANAHLSTPNRSLNFPTIASTELHIAAHETAHAAYSTDHSVGLKYQKELASSGQTVSLYHALAGHFEGLMDLGAAYAHSPDALKNYSPELHGIAARWAGEMKARGGRGGVHNRGPLKLTANAPSRSKPARRRLLFLRVFPETMATIASYDVNPASPRFGQPTEYVLTFLTPTAQGGGGMATLTTPVHWTRCIHIADNLGSSEVFGTPRQQQVLNRLLDLRKLYGGSAEMYWRGAFPGYSIETLPQLGTNVEIDEKGLRDQMYRWANGLQRYVQFTGMSMKGLSPQVVDPTGQINTQLEAICVKIGVPKRKFLGSERGELSSTQDEDDWNDKVSQRQNLYVTPRIIVPFVDRLIALGVLPPPAEGYLVEWPGLSGKSESQQATIGGQRTTALVAYAGQPAAPALMAPMDFFTRIMGFTEDEAQTIVDNAEEEKKRIQAEEDAKAKVQADALAKAQAQQAAQTPPGPDGGGPSGPGPSGGGGPGGGQPPGDNAPGGGGRPFDGPAGNAFCATGPGGGVDPSCSPKSTPPASRAERLAKRIEREEAVRKKLGEGRIRAVKEVIKDLLPRYAHTTVHGIRVKAFDPAVPEDHLVAEMGRRGLPTARGAAHRVLDAMAFAGEIVKVTTGAGDPLSPNKMLHSYRLPRPVTGNVATRPAPGMVRVTSGGRVWYEPAPVPEGYPAANYNPDQPRHPAGTAGGGRFAPAEGAGTVPAGGPAVRPQATRLRKAGATREERAEIGRLGRERTRLGARIKEGTATTADVRRRKEVVDEIAARKKAVKERLAKEASGSKTTDTSGNVTVEGGTKDRGIGHVDHASEAVVLHGHVQRLEAKSGGLVHLSELRIRMHHLSKDDFDKTLQESRRQGLVTLSGAEGRHGLREIDRLAGVHEEDPLTGRKDRLLLYASSRGAGTGTAGAAKGAESTTVGPAGPAGFLRNREFLSSDTVKVHDEAIQRGAEALDASARATNANTHLMAAFAHGVAHRAHLHAVLYIENDLSSLSGSDEVKASNREAVRTHETLAAHHKVEAEGHEAKANSMAQITPGRQATPLTIKEVQDHMNKDPFGNISQVKQLMRTHHGESGLVKVHGMSKPEEMEHLEVGGIKFHYPRTDQGRQAAAGTIANVAAGAHKIPAPLWKATTDVVHGSGRNTADPHWAREYNDPSFRSNATGGDGKTVVYGMEPGSPKPGPYSASLSTFAHEAGHNFAKNPLGWAGLTPPAGSAYHAAQQKEQPVTEYARNSPSEDFAEAAMMYTVMPKTLQSKFPLKHKAFHDLMEAHGGGVAAPRA